MRDVPNQVSWTDCELGEVIELKRGYDLSATVRQPGNIPIVSSSGISGRHSAAKVKGPGVVTGRYGTIGKVFYVNEDFWPLNTTLYVTDFRGANPRFVSYFLSTIDFRAYSDKAAVPGVNRNDLHRALVSWPKRSEQDRIASLLGSLDAKIELNGQIAATLESTASALFQSWFVNFDPVRAKVEGRDLALPADIAAVFPDRFDGSGLPNGWTKHSLLNYATVVKGSSYKGADLQPGARSALVTLKSFRRGGGYRPDGLKAFVGPYKPAQHVMPGEIVVAATDVTQAADIIGQCAIVEPNDDFDVLVGSLDTFIVRPKSAAIPPWFMEAILRANDFHKFASQYTSGTTVLHLSNKVFDDFHLCIPPPDALTKLVDILAPLQLRKDACRAEKISLTRLRDILLPKLISGDLRIAEATPLVAAA